MMRDLRRDPPRAASRHDGICLIVTAAVVGGVATVGAGVMASKSANKATNAQTAANQAALDEQQREYDTTRSDQAPWRMVGQGALQQMAGQFGIQVPTGTWAEGVSSGGTGAAGGAAPAGSDPRFGSFFASPDYQFRLSEGQRALTGNNAAKGLIDSGAMGKGLISYSQNVASSEYGNWYNRLSALAGVGQTATNMTDQLGAQNAANRAGIIQNQGQNLATGYATQGGIQAGVINGVGNTVGGLIKNWPTSGGGGSYAPPAYQNDGSDQADFFRGLY